jgi:hypothetical protein
MTEDDIFRVLCRDPFSNIERALSDQPYVRGYTTEEFHKWLNAFGWTLEEFVAEYNKRISDD